MPTNQEPLTPKHTILLDRIARTVATIPPQRLEAFTKFIEREAERERADASGNVDEWPDTTQVVFRWRVPERTLRRHVAEGLVRPVRTGAASRFYRFDPVELDRVYGKPAESEPTTKHGAPPKRRKPGGG